MKRRFKGTSEFQGMIGCCEHEGRKRDFYQITHIPTGKSRRVIGDVTNAQRTEMMNELVLELRNEGIMPDELK